MSEEEEHGLDQVEFKDRERLSDGLADQSEEWNRNFKDILSSLGIIDEINSVVGTFEKIPSIETKNTLVLILALKCFDVQSGEIDMDKITSYAENPVHNLSKIENKEGIRIAIYRYCRYLKNNRVHIFE